jgi:hypothetical protein
MPNLTCHSKVTAAASCALPAHFSSRAFPWTEDFETSWDLNGKNHFFRLCCSCFHFRVYSRSEKLSLVPSSSLSVFCFPVAPPGLVWENLARAADGFHQFSARIDCRCLGWVKVAYFLFSLSWSTLCRDRVRSLLLFSFTRCCLC